VLLAKALRSSAVTCRRTTILTVRTA
jgi:hypothetical protein